MHRCACTSVRREPRPSRYLEYTAPHHAQEALAGREGCTLPGIGLWPGAAPIHSAAVEVIAAWAEGRGVQAVVWTALKPKFDGIDGTAPGSAEAAVEYLRKLDAGAQARARAYVERAPTQIRTAYRAVFEAELGWLPKG